MSLLERLAALPGTQVSANPAPGPGGLPHNADLLLRLDSLLTGTQRAMTKAVTLAAIGHFIRVEQPVDLVLDLCGDVSRGPARLWRLEFNGAPGEGALLGLMLGGQSPTATIREGDQVVAAGRLGAEYNGSLLSAFEDLLRRTATLIHAALLGAAKELPTLPQSDGAAGISGLQIHRLGTLAVKQLAGSVIRHLYHLCYNSPHWRVGWRCLDGDDLFALRDHPRSGWHTLADDRRRFYADPFPLEINGQTTVFVEEFPHSTGKGIISAVTMGPHGPVGTPRPVLELPHHLSYPFVFKKDGEVWMVPESCAAETIDLFRATAFPGGWVKEATLVAGVTASDATLVEHGGKWWMFATVRDGGGAFSDTLHLWSAADFRGPWRAHGGNPVMIDIASARPAGRIVQRGGSLFRPVQDCRHGYGAALGIARVLRLDDGGFAQAVETVLTAGPLWPGTRLHTVNSGGGFEFIDGSARASRLF